MRVVRDAMVPKPSEAQIAEILMSDFLQEIPGAQAGEQAYSWEPGVQRELSFRLTGADLARVGRAVVGWMNARTGSPQELTALMPDPGGTERLVLTEETLPFARLYADNLRHINREAEADRLTSRLVAYAISASGGGGTTEEADELANGAVPLQEEAKHQRSETGAGESSRSNRRRWQEGTAIEDLEEGESGTFHQAERPADLPESAVDEGKTIDESVARGVIGAGTVVIENFTIYNRSLDDEIRIDSASEPIQPCPYPGLAYFGPEDADLFFGRDAAIARLVEAVGHQTVTVLVGASGSGKSSVVLAGLAPRLNSGGRWRFTHFRIGNELDADPFLALARALVPLYVASDSNVERLRNTRQLAESLQSGELTLRDVFADCRTRNKHARILLIADQFEETFTLINNEALRYRFIDALLAGFPDPAQGSDPDICMILTLRADFYGYALRHRRLADTFQGHVENLGPMNREELQAAISRPAERANVSFEAGLVETLLDDVENKPGSLPLLQFALREMWARQQNRKITRKSYDEVGGIEGALAQRAEAIFSTITANGADSQIVRAFQRLFSRLVTMGEGPQYMRRVVDRGELGNEVWSLAQRLAGEDNRLIVTNARVTTDGLVNETAELAHDSLIRSWPRLMDWISQDRDFLSWLRVLRPRVDEWQNLSRDADTLLRGRPLVVAEDWLQRRPEDFSDDERSYIEAGLALRDAGVQAVRRVEQAQATAIPTRIAILYLNFDLMIRQRTQGAYRAQVLSSPVGEAWADFTFPFTDLELENFLLRVGRPRRFTRRIDSPEMEAAKYFGKRLYDAVFSGDIGHHWRSSLREAEAQNAGLRLRLRVADAPELNDVPWEYLYNAALNRFLSLSEYTPLVRYVDMPEPIRPLPVEGQLNILVMISSPTDYPVLDVEGEWSRLNEALAGPIDRGQVRLRRLSEARPTVLQRELRQGEYHVLHFIGHAGFDRQTQGGVLIVRDEEGRGRLVAAENLGAILHDHRSLRLVVLNACEGARASRADPFTGLAQTLVQQGVPAVVAMQFEVTDQSAITFAEEFYGATAVGYPVDAALSCARKAIFAAGSDTEWGTPVLVTRAADGKLFSVNREAAQRAEEKQRAEVARRAEEERQQAEAAWQAAEQRLPRIAISYRREDSAAITGRIFDRLVAHYGRDAVFRDIEAIPLGVDFREYINTILARTDVGLVVVGKRWFGARRGGRRIDNPADPVRVELEIILRRGMPVVPILVEGGAMPTADQLPDSLKELVYHNGLDVDSGRDFDQHIERLIRNIGPILIGAERRRAEEEKRQAEAARIAEEEKQWAEAARRAEEEQQRTEAARQAEEKKAGLSFRNPITAIMKRWREGRGRGEDRRNR
jgi:hypothetical protein